jgi:hypothetical protein
MMLPAAALTDCAAAPQLLLRAWVHEAMRTFADRLTRGDVRDAITQRVGVFCTPCNIYITHVWPHCMLIDPRWRATLFKVHYFSAGTIGFHQTL